MGDSYRPGGGGGGGRSLADRMTFTSGGGDNYRPGGNQQGHGGNHAEFTFSAGHQGPRFPPTGPSNPDGPARRRPARSGGQYGQRDQRRGGASNGQRGRGGRRGGFKAAPHERALLQVRDGGSPERSFGIVEGSNRFQNVDEMSDDEEADMEVGGSSQSDEEGGNHKTARTQANDRADGDSVPKWCNPETYTALPPPEERTGKKIDFVKLIRKAKNEAAEKTEANNAVAANDDFISFGDADDEPPSPPREEAPRAPHRPQHHPVQGSLNDLNYNEPERTEPVVSNGNKNKRSAEAAAFPEPPRDGKAIKRKRDEFERGIVHEWMPIPHRDKTPWVNNTQNYAHLADDPLKWLHNEILDFYDFVCPTKLEHEIRGKLVDRVQAALGTQRFPHHNGRILCFGSYPAGLYLPTADMDLVYTSDRHYNGGPPVMNFASKSEINSTLRKAGRRLESMHIATNVLCITKAKVPIIKFVDRQTNINVDISFENLSGVQAQATFQQWKKDFPDMLYMVALLKQFLVMRGYNEVHTGGLGGFSIICLVVSYIQHHPGSDNLGACFLGFLKYYGTEFDLQTQRIQMHPPAVVLKTPMGVDGRPERPNGLSIQDPNRPDNNISGGSHKAHEVFRSFGSAYRVLSDRIAQRGGRSILECILGGNYDTYHMQRRHMDTLKPCHSCMSNGVHRTYWDTKALLHSTGVVYSLQGASLILLAYGFSSLHH